MSVTSRSARAAFSARSRSRSAARSRHAASPTPSPRAHGDVGRGLRGRGPDGDERLDVRPSRLGEGPDVVECDVRAQPTAEPFEEEAHVRTSAGAVAQRVRKPPERVEPRQEQVRVATHALELLDQVA